MRRALPLVLAGLFLVAGVVYLFSGRGASPGLEARGSAIEGENPSVQPGELDVRSEQAGSRHTIEEGPQRADGSPSREGHEGAAQGPGDSSFAKDLGTPLGFVDVLSPPELGRERLLTKGSDPIVQVPRELGRQYERPHVSGADQGSIVGTFERLPRDASSSPGRSGNAVSALSGMSSAPGKASAGVSGAMLPASVVESEEESVPSPGQGAARGTESSPEPLPEDVADEQQVKPGDGEEGPEDSEAEQEEALPPESARVWLSAFPAELGVGEIVEITVHLEGADEVSSVPFHLEFDSAKLAFAGSSEGALLAAGGAPTAFLAVASSAGDRLVVGISRLGQLPGAHGAGELCRLRFEALEPGRAALRFARAKVLRANGELQPAEFSGLELHIR